MNICDVKKPTYIKNYNEFLALKNDKYKNKKFRFTFINIKKKKNTPPERRSAYSCVVGTIFA